MSEEASQKGYPVQRPLFVHFENDINTYAIQDEYVAQKEYKEIMDKYGNVRPFSNIINAEANHIEQLKTLLEQNGFSVVEYASDGINLNSTGNLYVRYIVRFFPTLGRSLIIKAKKV